MAHPIELGGEPVAGSRTCCGRLSATNSGSIVVAL
jgi:hypothetical protein